MKNFVIAFLLTLNVAGISAQNITEPEASFKQNLCRSWSMSYAMANGKKIQMPTGTESFRLKFNEDHTYDVINSPEGNESNKWVFEPENKRIVIYRNNKPYFHIATLTAAEIILVPPPNSDMELGPAEVHLKPAQ